MMEAIRKTLVRSRWHLLVLAILYALCIAGGALASRANRSDAISTNAAVDRDQNRQAEQLESIFGRFRQPVRDGAIGSMLLVMVIVFTINLLGTMIEFALPGILIVPLGLTLLVGGWMQGSSVASIHASSLVSMVTFLIMQALEWVTYVMASAAGLNMGISFLMPATQGIESRGKALRLAFADAGRMYILIAVILAAQAVLEVLYIRKVLLMGDTGIPLAPY